jgi:hypothetical protein
MELIVSELSTPDLPPYHLVNREIRLHIGPFSTYTDAVLARYIGEGSWKTAQICNREEFDVWLAE